MTKWSKPSFREISDLNKTEVSLHVEALLRSKDLQAGHGQLVLMALLEWAAENHYEDALLGQLELASLTSSARHAPRSVYTAMADDRMLDARCLDQASEVLVSRLSDLFDDRSLPPHARP